jgi:hypothetical protein
MATKINVVPSVPEPESSGSVARAQQSQRPRSLFAQWAALIYALTTGLAEAVFIEAYCHWHGAQFLLPNPFQFYSPENIAKLANIDFVARVGGVPTGSPTVMSMAAEILMWSSLGVWAQRISTMAARYRDQEPNLPYDLATYIGILGCHTGVAAGVLIILKLSSFHIFNVSVDNFEATVGAAFLLGYFGDETVKTFGKLRETLFKERDGRGHGRT